MDLEELYFSNEPFREYVNKYCSSRHLDLDTALTHKIVHEYALYLKGLN